MTVVFDTELQLVKTFVKTYKLFTKQIVIEELDIRYGNIDVVSIKNINLPFTSEQIEVLSKPSCAMVFSYLKNYQLLTLSNIQKNIGLSGSSLQRTLAKLVKVNLIEKYENKYQRKEKFEFPKTIISGYEAKLTNFNKAFYQAKNNQSYVDYSYLVFPEKVASRICINNKDLLERNGIGLIAVSEKNSIQLIKAKKNKKLKKHVRLLSLTKSLTHDNFDENIMYV